MHARADRKRTSVARVLTAMKNGASLHLQHSNGRALWSLSDGTFVHSDIAKIVTHHVNVTTVGDTLFAGVPY